MSSSKDSPLCDTNNQIEIDDKTWGFRTEDETFLSKGGGG
jgi:hypothetical protein